MIINFKRLKTGAELPIKATKGAACYDAIIPEDFPPLEPNTIRIIPLGFSCEVPEGYELQVRSRSGLASKGILVANGVGCVDSDYRGELGVILYNASQFIIPLSKGDRICQLKLSAAPEIKWNIIDELSDTDRGEGGYGSTDKNI